VDGKQLFLNNVNTRLIKLRNFMISFFIIYEFLIVFKIILILSK
jgi:hypothetical protein